MRRFALQSQGDVGWLHRLPYHSYQVVAQGLEVCLVAHVGREGSEGLSGLFDFHTPERLYCYSYLRYE
jgi:hypothetical protein